MTRFPPLSVSVTSAAPAGTVVEVAGEVDMATAPQLYEGLMAALSGGGHEVVVDVSGIRFIDASGIETLLRAAESARESGRSFQLHEPSKAVRRLLVLLELNSSLCVNGHCDAPR